MPNFYKSIYTIIPYLLVLFFMNTGCNSDHLDLRESDKAIAFTAAAPFSPLERIETTSASLNSFRTWAFVDGIPYIDGIDVNRTDNGWTYAPISYWPLDKQLNFYSVSPASISNHCAESAGRYDLNGFRSPGTIDMLYAVNKNLNSSTNQVKVNFRHALSQVNFRFRCKEGGYLRAVIADVDLFNVYDSGNFTFPESTTSNNQQDSGSVGDWSIPETAVRTRTSINNTLHSVGETPEIVCSTGYEFFIPQDVPACTDHNSGSTASDRHHGTYLRVKCRIEEPVSGGVLWPSPSVKEYDAATRMAYMIIPLSDKDTRWIQGHSYTYTVSLSVPKDNYFDFDITVDNYPYFSDIINPQERPVMFRPVINGGTTGFTNFITAMYEGADLYAGPTEVSYNPGTEAWNYNPVVEWPYTHLNFFSFGPYRANRVKMTAPPSSDNDVTVDLMANNGLTRYQYAYDKARIFKVPGISQVMFRDALSRIEVRIKTNKNEILEADIRSVTLYGMYRSGLFKYPDTSTANGNPASNPERNCWTSVWAPACYDFNTGLMTEIKSDKYVECERPVLAIPFSMWKWNGVDGTDKDANGPYFKIYLRLYKTGAKGKSLVFPHPDEYGLSGDFAPLFIPLCGADNIRLITGRCYVFSITLGEPTTGVTSQDHADVYRNYQMTVEEYRDFSKTEKVSTVTLPR